MILLVARPYHACGTFESYRSVYCRCFVRRRRPWDPQAVDAVGFIQGRGRTLLAVSDYTRWFAAGLAVLRAATGLAGPAPFDLAGPMLEARVTRGSVTLPIGEVASLAPSDRLWIKADLPDTQSAPYLMVVAFLRGSTNPPPWSWFYRCDTWAGKCAQQGLSVTVPDDAQQVLVFLAPRTRGDFNTLVGAVRARPGVTMTAGAGSPIRATPRLAWSAPLRPAPEPAGSAAGRARRRSGRRPRRPKPRRGRR